MADILIIIVVIAGFVGVVVAKWSVLNREKKD